MKKMVNTLNAEFSCDKKYQTVIAQLPILLTIQDRENKYIAVAEKVATLCGFPDADNMLGTTNAELRCDVAEYAEAFDRRNNHVCETGIAENALSITKSYSDGELHSMLYERIPLFSNQQEVNGILIQAMELPPKHFQQISEVLSRHSYYSKKLLKYEDFHIIDEKDPGSLFTEREAECLFFTLRGKTSKEISRLIHVSPKTVEFHLANIKNKLNVTSKSQLIDQAIEQGYFYMLPASLVIQKELTG